MHEAICASVVVTVGLDWCACAVVANTQAVIHQIKYGRPSVAQMDL